MGLSPHQATVIRAIMRRQRGCDSISRWEKRWPRGRQTIEHMIRRRLITRVIEGETDILRVTQLGAEELQATEINRQKFSRWTRP